MCKEQALWAVKLSLVMLAYRISTDLCSDLSASV